MTESIPEPNQAIPISSRNIVHFAVNVPIEVALQCTDGIRIEGRYGDRIKYMLTDDRTMYVAPVVAERIRELDIQPGELFHLCKRQIKNGSRKTIHWAVERLGEAETELERDLRRSLDVAQGEGSPHQAATTAVPPPIAFYELGSSGSANGTHNGHGPVNGSHDSSAAAPPSSDTQLAHALKTAIAAAAEAEKFAKTLDYNIRFNTEDVRSMGITVLIGMQQRIPR
jgi:hypothetical protein